MPSSTSPPLEHFATIAERYIAFIDSFADARPENLYSALESLLADLHTAILPVVAEMNDPEQPELEAIDMSSEQWDVIAKLTCKTTAKETVALMDWHEKIEKPSKKYMPPSVMRAYELFDDLSDIYSDLHTGLTLWKLDTTESKIEASWQWRYHYDIHWGNHLFSAATTVHEIRYITHEG
ncbi:MAG: DUF5063 domain-containing protein [Phycisphaerales bacterium]|nr:DUF5063 domain-containing protein [Phycisphaerales bacterium]